MSPAGLVARIKTVPVSLQPPKRIREDTSRFIGRGWLLPKILEWWDQGDERVFLLAESCDRSAMLAVLAACKDSVP